MPRSRPLRGFGTGAPAAVVLLSILAGCTPDLTALEQRQRILERQLVEMEAEIAELEETLEDAGVQIDGRRREGQRPRGKNAKGRRGKKNRGKRGRANARMAADDGLPVSGHQEPTTERSEASGTTVERTGVPPVLPGLSEPERTETACGFKLQIPDLSAISDYPLNTRGLGRSGPIRLSLGGEPLTPHALPKAFERDCAGAFRHAGGVILFSPGDSPNLDGRTLELSLDDRVPMPRGGDGRPMYWVYAQTTLTGAIRSWSADWGDADAVLTGLVVGDAPVTVTFDDVSHVLSPGPFRLTHHFEGTGPFTTTLTGSPPEGAGLGGYALIDAWTVGNSDNAVVFTGDDAWAR